MIEMCRCSVCNTPEEWSTSVVTPFGYVYVTICERIIQPGISPRHSTIQKSANFFSMKIHFQTICETFLLCTVYDLWS